VYVSLVKFLFVNTNWSLVWLKFAYLVAIGWHYSLFLCWHIKYYMGAPRHTWVCWFQSPIYKAGGHCVLPAPITLWCLLSGSLPSGFLGCCSMSMHLERPARGDDVSSVVDVIPSTPQVMALQPIVSRSHHLLSPLDCQTVLCNSFNLEVAMLHRDLWLIDWLTCSAH